MPVFDFNSAPVPEAASAVVPANPAIPMPISAPSAASARSCQFAPASSNAIRGMGL